MIELSHIWFMSQAEGRLVSILYSSCQHQLLLVTTISFLSQIIYDYRNKFIYILFIYYNRNILLENKQVGDTKTVV